MDLIGQGSFIIFLVVGLELKRELVEGQFADRANITLPVIGALGGMAVPMLIYAALNWGDAAAMRGTAIPAATGTAIATNLVAGDPYLSIALPGRMYAPAYRGRGYSTLNLSRALEEGGTLVSPLVPWNAGGAIVITALGLGVSDGHFENLLYIPLSFACWMSPVIGIVYAYLGWFSPKASAAEQQRWRDLGEDIQIIDTNPGMTLKPSYAAS